MSQTAEPGTVRLHRILAAPPERVYRAFVDPAALTRWLVDTLLGAFPDIDVRMAATLAAAREAASFCAAEAACDEARDSASAAACDAACEALSIAASDSANEAACDAA